MKKHELKLGELVYIDSYYYNQYKFLARIGYIAVINPQYLYSTREPFVHVVIEVLCGSERRTHYWDRNGLRGEQYDDLFKWKSIASDVYTAETSKYVHKLNLDIEDILNEEL